MPKIISDAEMAKLEEGSKPKFISDEEMAKLESGATHTMPDGTEMAGATHPAPQGAWERGIEAEKKRFGEFTEGFSEKAPGAIWSAINVPGAIAGLVSLASKPTAVPAAVVSAAKGAAHVGGGLLGMRGAKGTGEAVGEMLPSAIPVGAILSKVGKMSRVGNIVKATGATKLADKAKIEELVNSGRLNEIPVSLTRGGLAKKIEGQIQAAVPELEAAKANLAGRPAVSIQKAVDDLQAQVPEVQTGVTTTTVQPRTPAGLTAQKPAPVTVTKPEMASLNQPLRSAINKQIDELVDSTGAAKSIKPDVIQKLKEQAQDAADKAYKAATEAGQEAGVGAQASEMAAKALRETLETHPGIPADVRARLTAANAKIAPLLSIKTPTEAARIKGIGSAASRSAEMLAGRGLIPMMAGGAIFSGPAGAAVGLGAHAFLQSTLFNTLSAAAKLKVAQVLQTQGAEAAVQAAFAAHIAENAAKREQGTPK